MTPAPPEARDPRPLVVHVVYRFDTGGLENGVVNLIDHMSPSAYRHKVLALTEVTDFRHRIRRGDVECRALGKRQGHGALLYPRLWRLLRQWRPAVVHTRNLAALEMQPAAWAAGVPARVHGEHGRDVGDLDGASQRHRRVRRLYAPFVHHYIALSRDLAGYLQDGVGIGAGRITQIYNGVDAVRFAPPPRPQQPHGPHRPPLAGCPFAAPQHWLVGTVGRMQTVKAQTDLATAFVAALRQLPALRTRLRLVLVGEGPLRAEAAAILAQGGVADLAWLPGERADVPDVMRSLDCFVLPSLAEGISNTILEAMASGLPVIATAVGGNPELVQPGGTGLLVPAGQPEALADAIVQLACDPAHAQALGDAGRLQIERQFSLSAMVKAYEGVYDRVLRRG